MVRISTIYDKDINKRVFLVRGDERYAHTTSVVISRGEISSSSAEGFVVPLSINVLRDTGSSSIALYDNDSLIDVIEWSESQNNSMNINSPTLAWGIDHNIVVRYMGNNECMASSAKLLIEAQTNTDKYTTSLAFSTLTRLTYPNQNYTVSVTVTCSEGNINGQVIDLYLDNTMVGSAEVNGGVATFTYSTNKEGLLGLTAKFDGSLNHIGSEVSTTVSSGLQVELTGLPYATTVGSSAFTEGITYSYGSDIYGDMSSVSYIIYGYVGDTRYNIGEGYFDGYGLFRDKVISLSRAYDSIQLVAIKFGKSYYSEKYPIRVYNITSIDLTGSPILVNGFVKTFTGKLNSDGGVIDNVPVQVESSSWYESEYINRVVYTNSAGEFEVDVWGDGSGDDYLTATVSTDYASDYVTTQFDFEDLLQYWDRSDREYNQKYTSLNARILKLANGYKIECVDNAQPAVISIPVGFDDYIVEYHHVAGTGDKKRTQIGHVNYQGTTSWLDADIRYERRNGVGSFYIDDNLEVQVPDTDINFIFGLNLTTNPNWKKSSITIDKFKLKTNHIDWED